MNGAGAYYYSGEQYPYLEGNFVNNNPEGNCIYHKDAGTQYTSHLGKWCMYRQLIRKIRRKEKWMIKNFRR